MSVENTSSVRASTRSFKTIKIPETKTSCHGRIWKSVTDFFGNLLDRIHRIFEKRNTDDFSVKSKKSDLSSNESSTSSLASERKITPTPSATPSKSSLVVFLEKDKMALLDHSIALSPENVNAKITLLLKNAGENPELAWEQILDILWEPKAAELAQFQISLPNLNQAKAAYLTTLLVGLASNQRNKVAQLENEMETKKMSLKAFEKRRMRFARDAEQFKLDDLMKVLKGNSGTLRDGLKSLEGWLNAEPKVPGSEKMVEQVKGFIEKQLSGLHTSQENSTSTPSKPARGKKVANKEDMNPVKETKVQINNGPFGIQNHGATCYMNASLQALMNIPAVRSKIGHRLVELQGKKTRNELKEDEARAIPLIEALKEFSDLKDIGVINGLLTERIFYSALHAGFLLGRDEEQNMGTQHDAQEFIQCILTAIDWPNFTMKSVIRHDHDNGVPSIQRDPTGFIIVDINDGQTDLQQIIENVNTASTPVPDYKDEKTGLPAVSAKKTESIEGTAPDYVFVQLKRFKKELKEFKTVIPGKRKRRGKPARKEEVKIEIREVVTKVENKVKIPANGEVDLRKVFTDPSVTARYRIVAKVNHSGSCSGGHYHANVLNFRDKNNRRWLKCNDEAVVEANPLGKSDLKGYVYVLERIKD